MLYGALKGATMYEAYFWRISIGIPYWSFIKVGCKPYIKYDKELV